MAYIRKIFFRVISTKFLLVKLIFANSDSLGKLWKNQHFLSDNLKIENLPYIQKFFVFDHFTFPSYLERDSVNFLKKRFLN